MTPLLLLAGVAFANRFASPYGNFRVEARTEPRYWAPELAVIVHSEPETRVELVRDPDREGFYAADLPLVRARYFDLELVAVDGGPQQTLWRRVIAEDEPSVTSFLVERDGPRASRVAWLPSVGSGPNADNEVSLLLAFGWGAICLGYVGWLARSGSR